MHSNDFYTDFVNEFKMVPEVVTALSQIPADVFESLVQRYKGLALALANLTPQQVIDIEKVHQSFQKEVVSGGDLEKNAAVYLQLLGKHRQRLPEFMDKLGQRPQEYGEALKELADSMMRAHTLKEKGKVFKDADPESDSVVWTQTQISNPLAIVHTVIAHFFERYTYKSFRRLGAKINLPKDFFLNALDDVIILEEMQNPGKSEIFGMWNTKKEKGGLSWLSVDKVNAYTKIYQ